MSIIDRIILSIYTILLTVLSLIAILLSAKILPQEYWQQGLSLIYGRWEAALIGGVFFLVSIRLLLAGLRSRRGPSKIVHQTEMGVVEISIGAVEDLIAKTARHTRGVRNAKCILSNWRRKSRWICGSWWDRNTIFRRSRRKYSSVLRNT